jgi:AcrR family transcriptional regulator
VATEQRTPLSRDRILRSGVALADSAGVEAVTMRRLGDELGFEAMSLYRHVANKDDLLDGMLDLVIAEWELPDAGVKWPDAIRSSARSVHDALRRHPWAARLLVATTRLRPGRLRYGESLLATLRRAGFDLDRTYHVYHLLDGHIFGFSMWEIGHTSTPLDDEVVREVIRSIPWDEYPNFADHRDQHMVEGPHRDVNAFEVGLDLILNGLEGSVRSGPPPNA